MKIAKNTTQYQQKSWKLQPVKSFLRGNRSQLFTAVSQSTSDEEVCYLVKM